MSSSSGQGSCIETGCFRFRLRLAAVWSIKATVVSLLIVGGVTANGEPARAGYIQPLFPAADQVVLQCEVTVDPGAPATISASEMCAAAKSAFDKMAEGKITQRMTSVPYWRCALDQNWKDNCRTPTFFQRHEIQVVSASTYIKSDIVNYCVYCEDESYYSDPHIVFIRYIGRISRINDKSMMAISWNMYSAIESSQSDFQVRSFRINRPKWPAIVDVTSPESAKNNLEDELQLMMGYELSPLTINRLNANVSKRPR